MNLTIDLSPEEETRLTTLAEQEGVNPAALVRQLVRQHLSPPDGAAPDLGTELRDRLRRWQEQDHTPLMPAIPTRKLVAEWRAEDARMTDEEREAEDRFWEEFLEGLNETRQTLGMRLL